MRAFSFLSLPHRAMQPNYRPLRELPSTADNGKPLPSFQLRGELETMRKRLEAIRLSLPQKAEASDGLWRACDGIISAQANLGGLPG